MFFHTHPAFASFGQGEWILSGHPERWGRWCLRRETLWELCSKPYLLPSSLLGSISVSFFSSKTWSMTGCKTNRRYIPPTTWQHTHTCMCEHTRTNTHTQRQSGEGLVFSFELLSLMGLNRKSWSTNIIQWLQITLHSTFLLRIWQVGVYNPTAWSSATQSCTLFS